MGLNDIRRKYYAKKQQEKAATSTERETNQTNHKEYDLTTMNGCLEAAEAGVLEAQIKLGDYFMKMDKYHEPDTVQALFWYKAAAQQGNAYAQYQLGKLYETIYEDEKSTEEWYLKSATQGFPDAFYSLGRYYYIKDFEDKAIIWLEKSANEDNPNAMYILGLIHENHEEYLKAYSWYKKAADKGSAWGQRQLGFLYLLGRGVPRTPQRAFELFSLAEEQGDSEAQWALGYMYEQGEGVRQNYQMAIHWYTLSHEQGNSTAPRRLGFLYEYGNGVPKDLSKAAEYYQIAIERGNESAKKDLTRLKIMENPWYVTDIVKRIIIEKLGVKEYEAHTFATLEDLGADELDAVELTMELEKEFDISLPDESTELKTTVGDIIHYVQKELGI